MFGLGLATKIYVAIEAVDMRKGFEGLYGLVRDQLGQDPLSGSWPSWSRTSPYNPSNPLRISTASMAT